MKNQIYEKAWEMLDPLMEEYFSFSDRFVIPEKPTQEDLSRVHTKFINLRDELLETFGITMEQLDNEIDRRIDEEKY